MLRGNAKPRGGGLPGKARRSFGGPGRVNRDAERTNGEDCHTMVTTTATACPSLGRGPFSGGGGRRVCFPGIGSYVRSEALGAVRISPEPGEQLRADPHVAGPACAGRRPRVAALLANTHRARVARFSRANSFHVRVSDTVSPQPRRQRVFSFGNACAFGPFKGSQRHFLVALAYCAWSFERHTARKETMQTTWQFCAIGVGSRVSSARPSVASYLGLSGLFYFYFFGFKKFLSGLIQSREVSLSRKLRPRARASEGRDFFLQAASDTGEGEAAFRNSALVPLAPSAVGWMFVSRPPLLLTPGSRCDAVRSLREVAGPQLGPSRMDSCPDNERQESRVLSRQVRSQQCIKQKGAVTRPQARWHPDLKLPASRAVRSKFRWFARRPVCVPRRGRRRRLRTGSGALPCGKPACPDRSFRCLAVGASGTLPPRAQRCRRL